MAAAAENNDIVAAAAGEGEQEIEGQEKNDGSLLYVSNLPWSVDDEALHKIFSAHGKVVNASVVISTRTGRSRGYAFVQMSSPGEAQEALKAVHESIVEERDLRVEVARQTKKEAHARPPRERRPRKRGGRGGRGGGGGGGGDGDGGRDERREVEKKEQPPNDGTLLYVSNLPFAVEEDELRDIFAKVGEVANASIVRSSREPFRSRGFGFVKFETVDDAKKALEELNGTSVGEREIRIEIAKSTVPSEGGPRRRRRNRNRRRRRDDENDAGEGEQGANGTNEEQGE